MSDGSNISITDPSIRRLFEGKNLVYIASLMKDGSPQVTPTWVDIENGTILVNTAVGRTKQKNISRDQRVVWLWLIKIISMIWLLQEEK